jgi:hypothetical protein
MNTSSAMQSQRTCQATSDDHVQMSNSVLVRQKTFYIIVFCWQSVIILSWFMLKLSNSLALLSEGLLSELLACLFPHMDCQNSLSFLLVQPLIISLVTYANMPGPITIH